MFRFIKYILFFVLGYRIIKMLFSGFSTQGVYENEKQIGDLTVINPPVSNSNTNESPGEHEYIDYEEIK